MKAILSMCAFVCFAVMFGIALVATQSGHERYEYQSSEDDML